MIMRACVIMHNMIVEDEGVVDPNERFEYGGDNVKPEQLRVYLRARRGDMPSCYFCQVCLPNCWSPFFLVFPKLDGCQVEIPNSWRCPKEHGPIRLLFVILVIV